MRRDHRRAVVLTVAAALVAVACTGGDSDDAATTTAAAPITAPPADRPSDGVLRIGVLLPRTGTGAQLGRPMIDAAETARDRINGAGGVNGRDVVLVAADEGDTITSAAGAFDSLLRSEVDAIVGPASSLAALGTLDAPVEAGVVTCSPTATALALDEYPDDGLFFRTVPSDSLQAAAIASVAARTGARTISIAHLDDPYGRDLAGALTAAVAAQDVELLDTVAFASDDEELGDEAATLLDAEPGVVAVLGDGADGSRFVAALADAIEGGDVPWVLVNDAMRNPASQPVMLNLPRRVRDRVQGIAPLATSADETLVGPYAANAYDCVNLIALAALQGGSDAAASIAANMTSVSTGGALCRTYAQCAERLVELDQEIDYDGPSGNTTLSQRSGDPVTGWFETFTFDNDGQDVSGMSLDVSSD